MAHQYSRVGFKSSVEVNQVNSSLSYGGVNYFKPVDLQLVCLVMDYMI